MAALLGVDRVCYNTAENVRAVIRSRLLPARSTPPILFQNAIGRHGSKRKSSTSVTIADAATAADGSVSWAPRIRCRFPTIPHKKNTTANSDLRRRVGCETV